MAAAENTSFVTIGVLCPDGSAVQRLETILGPLRAKSRGAARRLTLLAIHTKASAFVWDAVGGRLTLLRDRAGVVRLYHAEIGGALF